MLRGEAANIRPEMEEAHVMTSRTSRHRPVAVLAALTLAIAACVGAGAVGPASAVSAPVSASASASAPAPAPASAAAAVAAVAPAAAAVAPGSRLVPLKVAPKPVFKPDAASPTQPSASSNCGTVRTELTRYAARHVQRVSCTTITPDAAQPKAAPQLGARLVKPLTGSWCGSQDGIWL